MLGFTGILGIGGLVGNSKKDEKKTSASEPWSTDGVGGTELAKLHAERERIMAEQKRMMSLYGMKVTTPAITVRPYTTGDPIRFEDRWTAPSTAPMPAPTAIRVGPALSPADMARYSAMLADKFVKESALSGYVFKKPKSEVNP